MSSLGRMAGGVAHHFNNILGGIATTVDFALSTQDARGMRRALEATATAVARASRLTEGLLAFAEGSEPEDDLADLTEAVLRIGEQAEAELAERGIVLQVQVGTLPVRPVPAGRITTVIDSVLSNAVESMPNGGRLTVGIAQDKSEIVMTFSDTGMGIREIDIDQVFDPFFTTKRDEARGAVEHPGLGLAIAHGIVKELAGQISATSKLTEGTTIEIRLPIVGLDAEPT